MLICILLLAKRDIHKNTVDVALIRTAETKDSVQVAVVLEIIIDFKRIISVVSMGLSCIGARAIYILWNNLLGGLLPESTLNLQLLPSQIKLKGKAAPLLLVACDAVRRAVDMINVGAVL